MFRYLIPGLVILFAACQKPDITGSDVIPSGDQPGVVFSDSATLLLQTVREDSLVGSNNASPMFLGSLFDREIGVSHASFYMQAKLISDLLSDSTSFNLTSNADSVYLSFGYSEFYGDVTAEHQITVYEMDEAMSTDSIYYTTHDFRVNEKNVLGRAVYTPRPNDSITVNGVKLPPHFRIKLNKEFGTRFIRDYNQNPSLFTTADFTANYFRGIYIKDEVRGNGCIMTFNPISELNLITIYYKRNPSDVSSSAFTLLMNSSSARSNRFTHKYNPGIFSDTVTPARLYIQSMTGLKAKIRFPNIASYKNSDAISINKAELVVKIEPGSDALFDNHSSLLIYAVDSLGRNTFVQDVFEPSGFIGGDENSGTYKLNFSRQMQRIINGNVQNFGVYLVAGGSVSNARRTILSGAGSVKLNLTYTLINK